MSNIIPKEITQDCDTDINTASFDYYGGIKYCKERGLLQGTKWQDLAAGTHFIVCCGDVMVLVHPTDFPDIARRIF